jgi:hypothetical protein
MKGFLSPAIAVLLIISLSDLNAQVRYGSIFGVNLATMTLKENGISYNPKISTGIQFGGFLELPVAGNLVFHPSLIFSAKGSVYKTDTAEFSISPIYLEAPIIVVLKIGSGKFGVSFFGGPYFACGVGGYKMGTDSEMKDLLYGSGGNKDIKAFDLGVVLGAGINIKSMLISAQYEIGLVNLSPHASNDSEMKNTVIGITLTSLFPARK